MPSKYYVTKERLQELKQELEELKAEKRLEIAERLRNAKEYGDLSENSEYTEARSEQERVESRIFELEEMMKRVEIIKKSEGLHEVAIGSVVTVRKGNQTFHYEIVGSTETRPEEGKISNESPLGRILLGKKVGDSVEVEAPSGKISYQISQIE